MWILNDGQGEDAGKNCALVSLAALVSHRRGKPVTSSALLRDLWCDLVQEVAFATRNKEYELFEPGRDRTMETLEALQYAQPESFVQNGEALSRLMDARRAVMVRDAANPEKYRDLDRYVRRYRNSTFNGCAPWEDPRAAAVGDFDGVNNDQFRGALYVLRHRLEQDALFARQGLSNEQVIAVLADDAGPGALFVLHSQGLGHWLFGYTSAPVEGSLWARRGLEVRFVDYQPERPLWGTLPFLGVSPGTGKGSPLGDLIVVRGRPRVEGLPQRQFEGEVQDGYVDVLDPPDSDVSESTASAGARTAAPTAAALRAATSSARGSKRRAAT